MNKTEISKQLAEQENRGLLASQASQMERTRLDDAERLATLTDQMATLAEAMAAMTKDTQASFYEMAYSVKSLRAEAETALMQTKWAGRDMRAAFSRITWKMGAAMGLTAILAAPAAVSAYLLLQRHFGEERAQAAEWRDFKAQIRTLGPGEAQKLSRILHWGPGK